MNGQSTWVDAELQRALAVEPSPEFLARVRTRLAAAQPEPSPWSFGWRLSAGVAMAAVVLVVLAIERPWPTRSAAPLPSRALPSVAVSPSDAVGSGLSSVGSGFSRIASSTPALPSSAVPSSRVSPFPEVLLDPREREGLRLLIAALDSGRVRAARSHS